MSRPRSARFRPPDSAAVSDPMRCGQRANASSGPHEASSTCEQGHKCNRADGGVPANCLHFLCRFNPPRLDWRSATVLCVLLDRMSPAMNIRPSLVLASASKDHFPTMLVVLVEYQHVPVSIATHSFHVRIAYYANKILSSFLSDQPSDQPARGRTHCEPRGS
eukprot:GHVU01120268.1.p2 GENE.GHVU01120268.1~~GHVU01120268.1.p2  ORF type:complete len:163 (-),score=1.91 GHVU01120268.1:22-510(-)